LGSFNIACTFSSAWYALPCHCKVINVLLLPCPCCCSRRLAHANLGFGLASAAGLLALADKASLATAFLSFSCGLSGELLVSGAQPFACQLASM
jgi:hypothetical protein